MHAPNTVRWIYSLGAVYYDLQADAPDSVEAMVAQLTEGLDLGGEESEEELQKLFEGMMSQLMSKEILYEPLKELYTKVRVLSIS